MSKSYSLMRPKKDLINEFIQKGLYGDPEDNHMQDVTIGWSAYQDLVRAQEAYEELLMGLERLLGRDKK